MRKRTRRKVYALVNPISFAIQGAAISQEADLDKLRIRELAAIDAFARGAATIGDLHDINAILGLAETMAKAGIGREEVLPACAKAQEHLIDAARRFERTQKMGTTGLGLTSFRDLYAFHDLQRQSVSRSEYEKAIKATTDRIKSKAPDVIEL
jgi:hypothetical protein